MPIDTVTRHAPVLVVDLADPGEVRWPAYRPAMLAHQIRGVYAMPVVVGGQYAGALDLFRTKPGVLSGEELAGAFVAADLAELPVLDLIGDYLQAPMADADSDAWIELGTLSRAEVSQATGMLMAAGNRGRRGPGAVAGARLRHRPHRHRRRPRHPRSPTATRGQLMPETPRETRVLDAVVTLVDSLLADFDVVELLTQLTEHCAQLLDVASAGLLLAGPLGQLHLMAATSENTHELELFELQADEGPCLDCYATGQPISVADLSAATQRWPGFVPAATGAGFASVHAVPMRAAGTVLGALGLFGTRTGELNDADLLVAQTLSHIACVAILQEHPPTPATVLPHLRTALISRVVVEQAKGYLHERLDVSVEDAFTLLRRYARTHSDHLSEVARRLINDPESRQPILAALTPMVTRQS